MTTLTATTAEDGIIHVEITNGDWTLGRSGKGFLRTIVKAFIRLKILELRDIWEAFEA